MVIGKKISLDRRAHILKICDYLSLIYKKMAKNAKYPSIKYFLTLSVKQYLNCGISFIDKMIDNNPTFINDIDSTLKTKLENFYENCKTILS